jgi:dihydroorotase
MGISPLAESSQVARIGEFARHYEVEVVISGASTSRTLEICRHNPWLKAQVPIHHLLLDHTACDRYDTAGKIDPPLKDEATKSNLMAALIDGRIDMLSAWHTPVSATAKDTVFAEAAAGINGLAYYLPLLYTEWVRTGLIEWPKLMRLTASAICETVGMDGGCIEVGAPARLILFDPEPIESIDDPRSPYRNREVAGCIRPLEVPDDLS